MSEPDDKGQRRDEQDAAPDAEHSREDTSHKTQKDDEREHYSKKSLAAIASRKTLNSPARRREDTRCWSQVPARAPTMAGTPTTTASAQLTSPSTPNAIIPNRAVIPIAARDVPVASIGAKPARRTRSGTTMVPPPTPKSALKKPAATPMTTYTVLGGSVRGTVVFSRS
jgi:hypothetical protein